MTRIVLAGLALLGATLPSLSAPAQPALARATFGGGCFWCMEEEFEKLPGVVSVVSGYAGGHKKDPTYEEVSTGQTGHAEVVQVLYDPARISYEKLLEVYWHNTDPTTPDRQFCDVGSQYRPVIFYHDQTQRKAAQASKKALSRNKPFAAPIVTQILPLQAFYPAEEYHQDYYQKDPRGYRTYRVRCRRDLRLRELWGPAPAERGS